MKKKILLMLFLIISFIGIINVKADNWFNPQTVEEACEMDTDGVHKKYYFYTYGGTDYVESNSNIWYNTCNGFKQSWLNAVGGADPSRAEIVYQQCLSDMNNRADVMAVRVGGTCKYTLQNQSTPSLVQQVFCLQGNVDLVSGSSHVYRPDGATEENTGISCGLITAYKDPTIRSQLTWLADGTGEKLDITSIPDSTVIAMQKKVWAHQYDGTNCKSSQDPNYAIVTETNLSSSQKGSVTVGQMTQPVYNSSQGTFVSGPINVRATFKEPNTSISVSVTSSIGAFVSTSSTATSGNSTITISDSEANVYVIVPKANVGAGTSNRINLTATASVRTSIIYKLKASFQKLTYDTSSGGLSANQGLGIPELKRWQEYGYDSDDASTHTDLTAPNGKLTIKKFDNNNTALGGAIFQISNSSNFSTTVTNTSGARVGDANGYVTIPSNGILVINNLPYGTYYIREVTAPDGYILELDGDTGAAKIKTVKLEAGASAASYEKEVSFINTPIKLTLNKKVFKTNANLANAKIVVKYKNGNNIEAYKEWTSSTTSRSITFDKVKAGDYYIYEELVPIGYEGGTYITGGTKKARVLHIEINNKGQIIKQEVGTLTGNTFTIIDPETDPETRTFFNVDGIAVTLYNYKLTYISKKDITGAEELPGAHIVISNDKTEDVIEFDSTTEPKGFYLENLGEGKYYYLTETVAPIGYETLETVFKFTVNDNGVPTLVEIGHWADEEQTRYVKDSTVTKDDSFVIDEVSITILDEPIKTILFKKDIKDESLLKNAHIVIYDEEKKVIIKEFNSDGVEGKEIDLEPGIYYIKETVAPEGYEISEVEYKIEVLENKNIKLLSDKDDHISINKNVITLYNSKIEVPNTGKSSNGLFYIVSIVAILLLSSTLIYFAVRKKEA